MTAKFPESTPYVIAEVGGNHGGDPERAATYVREAAKAGADAVKFQLYSAETLISPDEPPLPLAGEDYDSQFERFKELELDREDWDRLVELAESQDIDFAASVFDESWAEYAADVSPFIKIASGDLTNLPLLRHVASLDKPIVMSTGFASMDEIRTVCDELPTDRLTLLHCVSDYPTDEADANLQMIERLRDEFDVPIGYSDHTVGLLAAKSAMAKGAPVVEKHFTLNKSKSVGDHRLSANPTEVAELVEAADRIAAMHGDADRADGPLAAERDLRPRMRRSLVTARSIAEGETIEVQDLVALRPGYGLSPLRLDEVIGRSIDRNLPAGKLLEERHLQ